MLCKKCLPTWNLKNSHCHYLGDTHKENLTIDSKRCFGKKGSLKIWQLGVSSQKVRRKITPRKDAHGENAMENNHLCSCPGGLEKETSLEKRTQKVPVWKSESCWIVKPPTFSVDLFMTSGDMSATRLIAQALLVERQTAPWATSGKDVGIWYMKEW